MEDLVNPKFWKKKRVFITGHTGFKGSWLTYILNQFNSDIYGYSLKPETKPNLYKILNIKNLINDEFSNITNFKKIDSSIKKFKPEIFIHLAAQPLVRKSYLDPLSTYQTNVMGLMNVLLSIKKNISYKCVVLIITSDKCYLNNGNKIFFNEIDHLGGNDIYSSSKACAEILSKSFYNSFFKNSKTRLSTVRAGNIIGGGDWSEDRLISDLVRNIFENKKLLIRYPNAVRPWQHVLDPIFGYLKIIEKMWSDEKILGGWNIGPLSNKKIKVKDILDLSEEYLQRKINYKLIESEQILHEDKMIMLDTRKIKNKLGWQPKLKIHDSIRMTLDWYEAYYLKKNILHFTQKQIDEYLSQ